MSVNLRPPVVAVLGHVDHGKTSILDRIRNTRVQSKERGGITQSIGASVVTTKEGKNITFIDTPGHAAFSAMRSRGAEACDIAILVVAADDGVKPQTKEAIGNIKEAGIPMIVAFSKIDLSSASVEEAMGQLEKEEILFEGRGGSTPHVSLSAKTGEGIDDLLELIVLLSDVSGLKGSESGKLKAVVIETTKTKAGPAVSVVVKDGKIKVGSAIFVEGESIKVRGLFDSFGKSIKEANPGEPAQILGFAKLPSVGSVITDEDLSSGKVSGLNGGFKGEIPEGEIGVIIKASSTGSLEAVLSNLPKGVVVVESGVGEVNDSDVLLAKSVNARIFAFEVKPTPQTAKLAATEGVNVESFDIIYKLFERWEELVKLGEKIILGEAEIIATFPFNNKKVAGCRITKGEFMLNNKVNLIREEKLIGIVKIISIKKQKLELKTVKQGDECGIVFVPQLDFAIGDMLVSEQNQ